MPTTPRPIPSLSETSTETYAELGLRIGLEVHQQLLTEKKLFCRCPALAYRDDYDAEILRHMRPTLSEMGEYDGTALMEKKTKKEIIYQITGDTTCTYEMDDSPPFMINADALDIGLALALLSNTCIVGELQIARKQYLDGSIPTGFQRTAIIGLGGWIPYGDRRIGIRQVAVEEDACREIEDSGHLRTFRTDRLSRPLTETVTEPDMVTPQEAADVCRIIARLARGTGLVRTGAGAGRQDVNVSVSGGTRVEIKGVPGITLIPELVHYEAFRQRALLDLMEALGEKLSPGHFAPRDHAAPDEVMSIEAEPVWSALRSGSEARVVVLPGFGPFLDWPIGPNRGFVDELSDLARVVACLHRLPNLLWTGDAGTDDDFWRASREATGAGPDDALLLLWGPAEDVVTAIEEIEDRARAAFAGVPCETRQVLPSGETRFERILPGSDRMYPDTDLPPITISDERIDLIRATLGPPVWEREIQLHSMGVPEHQALPLAISPRWAMFDRIVHTMSVSATDAARVVAQELTALARAGVTMESIEDAALFDLFTLYAEGAFHREAFPDLLRMLADGQTPEHAVKARVGELALPEEVATVVASALGESVELHDPEARVRHVMGLAMPTLRGRAAGATVRHEVERTLGGAQS